MISVILDCAMEHLTSRRSTALETVSKLKRPGVVFPRNSTASIMAEHAGYSTMSPSQQKRLLHHYWYDGAEAASFLEKSTTRMRHFTHSSLQKLDKASIMV